MKIPFRNLPDVAGRILAYKTLRDEQQMRFEAQKELLQEKERVQERERELTDSYEASVNELRLENQNLIIASAAKELELLHARREKQHIQMVFEGQQAELKRMSAENTELRKLLFDGKSKG